MEQYILDKAIWTINDFEDLNWHDANIHAISIREDIQFAETCDLLFDIDYILQWLDSGAYYSFWIIPCTLMFKRVYDLTLNIDNSGMTTTKLEIDTIEMVNMGEVDGQNMYQFNIELQRGDIFFECRDMQLVARMKPICRKYQKLNIEERNGISFDVKSII